MKLKTIQALLLALLIAAGPLAAGEAQAHRGRVHFGISVGYPGWYYPAPYYYLPAWPYDDPYLHPSYRQPAESVTYIERAAPPEQQAHWWYYCAAAKAYYPYARECAGGWLRVSPVPPPGTPEPGPR